MLYAHIVAAVFSALRIALFNAFDATRPPDINRWEPGEYFANSTASCLETLSTDATDFGISALLVLKLAVIPPPPPSVTVIAIHPSKAISSLGHTLHLGSLFQLFHCAYEAPQFVSAQPSHCVALLKPTPISTAIYVLPTPVIPSTERALLPSVTWLTGLHWRVWTMVVNTFLRIVPCLKLVPVMLKAIAIFWSISFCAHWVLSGVMALTTCLLRARKNVKDHVSAAQRPTAWFKLVQVNESNELKFGISVLSPRFTTLLHANTNDTDLLWTIAIGPEPLPYTVPEDVEDVEKYIICSVSAPLSPALIISGKALNAPLSTGFTDPANIPLPFDADVGIELNPADVPLPSGADIGIELDPTMVPLPFGADVGIELNPVDVPLPFDADVGIELNPADVPLPSGADIGIELDPTMVPLPFGADVGIELNPADVPLPFDADVGIELNPADVPLPPGADIGIALDPTMVPLPFDADVGIALDPTMVPLPFDADIGIELDPTTVPLPFDADVGLELDASPSPTDATTMREESQTSDNKTNVLEVAEASSTTDTDGSLEHSLLGLKPIAVVEENIECHSVRTVDSKNDTVNDNQDIASDSGESTLVDSVGLNERLSLCSLKLHALDTFSDGIGKSTSSSMSCTIPTELGPVLASAADHEDSTKTVDQEEAIRSESSTTLCQDVGKDASSATSTPSPTLASESSSSVVSSSVPSSSDSSSLSASTEMQPFVLDDATSEQDTGAGQEGEDPAPKKKTQRGCRGRKRRFNKSNIILEVVGEGSSQSADSEHVERLQASGSGLLPSQRDPPTEMLAAAGTNATSVQHSRSYPGPQASGPSLSSSHQREIPLSASEGKGRAEEQPSVLDDSSDVQDTGGLLSPQRDPPADITAAAKNDATFAQRSRLRLGPQAAGSGVRPSHRNLFADALAAAERDASSFQRSPPPLRRGTQVPGSGMRSQREPPTGTLETRRRATPAQGERLGRPISNALRDGNGRNPRRQPPHSSRLDPEQEPSSSGQRERHDGWMARLRAIDDERVNVSGRGSMRSAR